ncbi:unnamed protein product [Heterotrigona itama]|uniref:CCHC-type domain-containing protein n=1 Tax=Heterotrigona itama TaxID=395501 RepID=A0A6V7H192_9HYME|nr:unnamed protein product [Heterotrigona itama]
MANEPTTMEKAQGKAMEIEAKLKDQYRRRNLYQSSTKPNLRSMDMRRPNMTTFRPMTKPIERRDLPQHGTPLAERQKMKRFKCGQTGHLASRCQDFQTRQQGKLPPHKINRTDTGHLASRCQDFQTRQQRKLPPHKINRTAVQPPAEERTVKEAESTDISAELR